MKDLTEMGSEDGGGTTWLRIVFSCGPSTHSGVERFRLNEGSVWGRVSVLAAIQPNCSNFYVRQKKLSNTLHFIVMRGVH
jgi:hypothetical protein